MPEPTTEQVVDTSVADNSSTTEPTNTVLTNISLSKDITWKIEKY